MAEEVAVVDARAAAELPHRVAQVRRDERVHHDRGPAARLPNGDAEVVDVLDARMPDLDEGLIRELRLEGDHEPLRGLARRVRHDVELDGDALRLTLPGHGGRLATGEISR